MNSQTSSITRALVALFAIVFLTPQVARAAHLPEYAVRAIIDAQTAMEKDDTARAIDILTKFTERHPEPVRPRICLLLGNAYWSEEKTTLALKAFEAGYNADPNDQTLCRNYALALSESGQHAKASQLFEKAFSLAQKPEYRLLYHAAATAFRGEDYARSHALLTRLLGAPCTIEAPWYELLAHTCLRLSRPAEAETLLTRAVADYREKSRLWLLLGHTRLTQSKHKAACAALEIAYSLKAPSPSSWHTLGELYFYQNAPLAGVRCFMNAEAAEKSTSNDKQSRRVRKLRMSARGLASTGRTDEAVALLDEALKDIPSPKLALAKARLLFEAGRYADSREALTSMLAKYPENRMAHLLHAYASWHLGEWDAAVKALRAASALGKKKSTLRPAIAYLEDLIEARREAHEASSAIL